MKLELMVLGVVLIMFTSHKAWGEQDCYADKNTIKRVCINSIKISGNYVPPSYLCRHLVGTSDMACICRVLWPSDEHVVSTAKLIRLASDCGQALSVGSKCGSKYYYLIISNASSLVYISYSLYFNE